jgi:hypothetical protein
MDLRRSRGSAADLLAGSSLCLLARPRTNRVRTLAYLCAHELAHIVIGEHVRLKRFFVPQWVWEGLPDYVGIERRPFEELWDALGDRPVDVAMMQSYGSYPRYRPLVTYFFERKGWSVEQLLQTRLTFDEANGLMRADGR